MASKSVTSSNTASRARVGIEWASWYDLFQWTSFAEKGRFVLGYVIIFIDQLQKLYSNFRWPKILKFDVFGKSHTYGRAKILEKDVFRYIRTFQSFIQFSELDKLIVVFSIKIQFLLDHKREFQPALLLLSSLRKGL